MGRKADTCAGDSRYTDGVEGVDDASKGKGDESFGVKERMVDDA
jgi:hypothetical protein